MTKTLDQYEPGKFALLLVGDQKTGKSRIMSAFPGPLFIDWDGNLKSVINAEPSRAKDIFYIDPHHDDKGKDILPSMKWSHMESELKKAIVNPLVKTLVVDSLTAMSDPLQDHIIAKADASGRKDIMKGRMEMQNWDTYKRMLSTLLVWMRATQKPVVWSSHQKTEYDEDGKFIGHVLSIPGQLKNYLGSLFTDCWATDTMVAGGIVKYQLFTAPKPRSVPLGRSSDTIQSVIDVTNKKPSEIWKIIEPAVNLK